MKTRRFNKKIKAQFPRVKFKLLEVNIVFYKTRYRSRILIPQEPPTRDIGWMASGFIYRALQRSRMLFFEFINNINNGNVLSSYYLVRGHFETTAAVAALSKALKDCYAQDITYEELATTILTLGIGTRYFRPENFPDEPTTIEFPQAINVITRITRADEMYSNILNLDETPGRFADAFNLLSEFCHPNVGGLSIGSEVQSNLDITFQKNPNFNEENLKRLITCMGMSSSFFFHVYDNCLSMLKDNEEMPEIIE
ncbi:MAG: hypothetical protein AB7I96_13210 [Candidatus Dadabacteria bacterium]